MNSLGIYKKDIWIKGKKCNHMVNVIEDSSDNIIGIDFMHKHWLNYDAQIWQVIFLDTPFRALSAIKQTVLPALSSSVINTQYHGDFNTSTNYIADICAPRMPMISGVSSIITFDKKNHCQVILENCTPCEVTIE